MHLPPNFKNVESLKSFLGIRPERVKRESVARSKRKTHEKSLVDVRSYGLAGQAERWKQHREKREAEIPDSETVESKSLKIENDPRMDPEKFMPTALLEERQRSFPETIIEMPAPIRGPIYSYSMDHFDMDQENMDPDDPRKRRNTSANDHDNVPDNNGRDKRTFMEGENRESTTSPPFWKRKKESPPFITGRDARAQNGNNNNNNNNNYTPAQHRSADNSKYLILSVY